MKHYLRLVIHCSLFVTIFMFTRTICTAQVKVNVEINRNPSEPNLLIYSKQRPLTLEDFKGQADDMSKSVVANTTTSLEIGRSSETVNNKVTLNVTLGIYFDKNKSWCKPEGHSKSTLAHEQIHFDIAVLKACELYNKIKSYSFSAANYGKELDLLHKKAQIDTKQEQDDYDNETSHGTIPTEQKKWSDKIKQQIATQSCF